MGDDLDRIEAEADAKIIDLADYSAPPEFAEAAEADWEWDEETRRIARGIRRAERSGDRDTIGKLAQSALIALLVKVQGGEVTDDKQLNAYSRLISDLFAIVRLESGDPTSISGTQDAAALRVQVKAFRDALAKRNRRQTGRKVASEEPRGG